MLKAVLFDLDGTLLPMNEESFTKGYFGLLASYLEPYGYNGEQLIKVIWGATKLMIKNDGSKTNDVVFWGAFADAYGQEKVQDEPKFANFYLTDFLKTKAFCGQNPFAKEIVNFAKNIGLKTVLASNPLFPKSGMLARAGFIGLSGDDFDYITSYENSSFSKPNPDYYKEILNKNGLKPEEVIYFCNSYLDDVIPAGKCGIKCFLLGDCISGEGDKRAYAYAEAIGVIKREAGI